MKEKEGKNMASGFGDDIDSEDYEKVKNIISNAIQNDKYFKAIINGNDKKEIGREIKKCIEKVISEDSYSFDEMACQVASEYNLARADSGLSSINLTKADIKTAKTTKDMLPQFIFGIVVAAVILMVLRIL